MERRGFVGAELACLGLRGLVVGGSLGVEGSGLEPPYEKGVGVKNLSSHNVRIFIQ